MKKKIVAGYINLKPINGVIFPSYLQNQMNNEFIKKKLKGEFFMSTNENMYGDNNIILSSLLKEKKLYGISMLSTFVLPEDINQRSKIYDLTFKYKKKIFFIFEDLILKEKKDITKIEENLIFKNDFFTKKISGLKEYEKKLFVDKSWAFV